jgi:REP element-mobilizing transposase RayT
MPRQARHAPGGIIYHVLNRAAGRKELFAKPGDYIAFTHVRRWVEHRRRVGHGSVYQGRYKSFPTEDDAHFTTVARYVERNPVRAKLVSRAESWPWSSAGQKASAEEAALRHCLSHGRPYGSEMWTVKMEAKLALRPPGRIGRPKKTRKNR